MLQKIRFFDKKDPKLSLSESLSGWQYSNLFIWPSMWTRLEHAHCLETIKTCGSWAKEKLSTRGRKRTLTDSEIKRNRSEVSSKWNKCRIYVGDQLDRCRWMERTQGSATRQISRWSGKDFAWLLLIGKPSMLPSFLNRFSYFMNLWWCLWSFSVDINQYM
jgi:hypothetical protein